MSEILSSLNITLKPLNRPLLGDDISRALKKYPEFDGVYDHDKLPALEKIRAIVVNHDLEEKGTHWVSLLRFPNDVFLHFDSYGGAALKEFEEAAINSPSSFRTTQIIQKENTVYCGHLCVIFISYLIESGLIHRHFDTGTAFITRCLINYLLKCLLNHE